MGGPLNKRPQTQSKDEKSDRVTDRAAQNESKWTGMTGTGGQQARGDMRPSADVTFDPETAYTRLIVSEDGKEVRHTDTWQRVTDNPKRFDRSPDVLAREGFTSGRHYWEVEVGGKTAWTLGVARESVNRKGEITVTPYDGYWTVWLRNENEYIAVTDRPLPLPLRMKPLTVGVFLDYDEGQVSFYNAQSHSHLYTFTDSFTEPLYPYFSPGVNNDGKNAAPLVICPLRTH
ncbi:E3 ubiquitin-protein ligase TRIM39-like [Polypterus senegalus]|uniref:E3 ubiquitin-protein ligase TRIM39-like n=1 Tax=Polypterus senegalus TaxID=55291 RepID=UPI001963B0B2|nr:E3 ubiquitin-protein ligase TRIM39-like [Polypterus senegalus]